MNIKVNSNQSFVTMTSLSYEVIVYDPYGIWSPFVNVPLRCHAMPVHVWYDCACDNSMLNMTMYCFLGLFEGCTRREWNWLCVNQHPWQRTRGHRRVTSDFKCERIHSYPWCSASIKKRNGIRPKISLDAITGLSNVLVGDLEASRTTKVVNLKRQYLAVLVYRNMYMWLWCWRPENFNYCSLRLLFVCLLCHSRHCNY